MIICLYMRWVFHSIAREVKCIPCLWSWHASWGLHLGICFIIMEAFLYFSGMTLYHVSVGREHVLSMSKKLACLCVCDCVIFLTMKNKRKITFTVLFSSSLLSFSLWWNGSGRIHKELSFAIYVDDTEEQTKCGKFYRVNNKFIEWKEKEATRKQRWRWWKTGRIVHQKFDQRWQGRSKRWSAAIPKFNAQTSRVLLPPRTGSRNRFW